MNLPISIAEKLIALQNGEKIPFGKLKHTVIESMLDNGILKKQIQGRSKAMIYLINSNTLTSYLKNHFGIDSLENYVQGYLKINLSRAEAIDISSNSKLKTIRTFKGFLVNSFEPVDCMLNSRPITIYPQEGTFTFIYDFEASRLLTTLLLLELKTLRTSAAFKNRKSYLKTFNHYLFQDIRKTKI